MDLSLSLVCGLVSALGWGVADWLARGISTSMGSFRAQLWSQLTGLVVLGVAVVVSGAGVDAIAAGTSRAWAFAALYALLIGGASICFFEAFGKGAVAVVAPIVGSYGAVTVVWSLLFGVEPSPRVLTGLVIVLAGVVAVSVPEKGTGSVGQRRGTIAAVVAALLFGSAFFVVGTEVVPTLGSLVPAFLSRLTGPVFGVVALVVGLPVARPPRDQRVGVVGAGVLSAVATVATGIGARGGDSSVVAVLGSLSVVVTVVIAMIVLRERLAPHQRIGIVVALIGIPILAL